MKQHQIQELLAVSRPAFDFTQTELEAARALRFVVFQTFAYTYTAPVRQLRQRLLAFPPARHGDQRRSFHRLNITPQGPATEWSVDAFGNLAAEVTVPSVTQSVRFAIEAVIERDPVPRLADVHSSRALSSLYLSPTALTAPDDSLTQAAHEARGANEIETAGRISEAVHKAIRYQKGVTTIESSAAEVFRLGAGVCQDHAHVMLAMCRALGIRARYVSGHLLGEGATHAWVEVITNSPGKSGAVAMPFDPCHGRTPDFGYVTVAVGRDYADVAPTSGSYSGVAANHLTSSTVTGVTLVN